MNTCVVSLLPLWTLCLLIQYSECMQDGDESTGNGQKYRVEGTASVPYTSDQSWITNTRIMADGGKHLAFLRNDGSFVLLVPTGSYVVEVVNPHYIFESVRIDVNSKGKVRARRLNNIQPSAVQTVTYPLRFKARGMAPYFQMREQWRITDFLFSPMVLTMFLPLILLMILPKLINTQDPEMQREMQQTMGILNPKQSLPELSEVFTKFFGGGGTGGSSSNGASALKKSSNKVKPVKKRS